MSDISKQDLYEWCAVPHTELESHPERRVPFRMVTDAATMGELMARELVDEIVAANHDGRQLRAIIPCGPSCWYEPFGRLVNTEQVSLARLVVFHMDECLDWEGKPLPLKHPYSFRGFMEREFYGAIEDHLAVPESQRWWPGTDNIEAMRAAIAAEPIDLTYGGWGQDGHVAYNQTRREPYSQLSVDELRQSSVRVQYNSWDTVIALAQRTFGTAYQFVPPMSVTLGMRECLSARKVRLWSDTGAWKQTALRVGLFGPVSVEYPLTLLQEHGDALLTATVDTARHPIAEHPEWELW